MAVSTDSLQFISNWYENLISNSNEKLVLANYIKKNLLREKIDKLLEIGMGTKPIFASILKDVVKNYVIVEKENVDRNILPENIKLINEDFETTPLDEKFDFIILSHVIYYFSSLNKAIKKAMNSLKPEGVAVFVVNGKGRDYGKIKHAFAEISDTPFTFTYDLLMREIESYDYEEHTINSLLKFKTYEDLYELLKLFFDLFPEEYLRNRTNMIGWLKENIHGDLVEMEQKLIIVRQ